MANSGFNQGQTGNATELGSGSVKLATQAQIDAGDADDGGAPLVVTPDKLGAGKVLTQGEPFSDIDASVLPKAVSFNPTTRGIDLVTNSAVSPIFAGFVNNGINNPVVTPDLLVTTAQLNLAGGAPIEIIVPVGLNAGMVIHVFSFGTGLPTSPTVTYNGVSAVEVGNASNGNSYQSIWFVPLGDIASPLTADLVLTGFNASALNLAAAAAYKNVSQITPTNFTFKYLSGPTTITDTAIVGVRGGIVSQFTSCEFSYINTRVTTAGAISTADGNHTDARYNLVAPGEGNLAISGAQDNGSVAIELGSVTLDAASVAVLVPLQLSGSVGGFAGLTAGERYFVDEDGDVTTTPGGQFVGYATSATKIQMEPNKTPKCRVYATADTHSGGVAIAVAFGAVNFDTDSFYSAANPTRLTIPAGGAGVYAIGGNLKNSNVNEGHIYIRVNGITEISRGAGDGYSVYAGMSTSTIYTLEDGDYVELVYQQSSGVVAGEESNFWLNKVS